MSGLGRLLPVAARLSSAALVATFAAALVLGPSSIGVAADDVPPGQVRAAEQRLLGSDDEAARLAACQPFTREIAGAGAVEGSFDASLAKAGVPAAVSLEARRALATAVDLGREVATGDRFYVRFQQAFTAAGAPIGVAHLLWAELVTTARGPVAVHRFRPPGGVERFWLANGDAATAPAMRLPLDTVTVSSGFGMRADPFDQPPPSSAIGRRAPMGGPGQPAGGVSGKGSAINTATPRGIALGLMPQPGFKPPSRGTHALFMHEGIDLAAPAGTPIYAASAGIVAGAAPNGGYGNWIRIDHPRNLATVYGHLSEFAPGISDGVQVSQGELIGFVGNTGRSTGPHLHFEILSNGKAVDPLGFPETRRDQLRGADLKRFRGQVERALAERGRETALALLPAH
jgi:murein DD-endopeptidase MepM/ murein hydrolase activator NlpD